MTIADARVSVVIPMYNAEEYIEEAIASVRAQTHKPYEVIAVDDGSTDKSAAIAERLGAICIRGTHTGAGAARNTGVERASGKFLAFLDADDLWTPEKTERQLDLLLHEPEVDMVFGHVQQFTENDPTCISDISAGYVPGTLLIRREQFLRVGPFSAQWTVGEFIDWYARATEFGLVSRLIPDTVLKRRIHDTNLGVRERSSQTDYARVIRAMLDRRRSTGNTQS